MIAKQKQAQSGSRVVYLTDVSQVETDDTCRMRYWFRHQEGGKGILNKETVVSQLLDTEIHNDLRSLSRMDNISPLAIQDLINDVLSHLTLEDKQDTGKMELLYRRLGWFAAFAIYREPTIRATYDTLPSDEAFILDKDPLWVVAYPDRIVKDKQTGEIAYWEYVQMGPGLTQERWKQGWHYNIRLHVGLAAAAANLDKDQTPSVAHAIGIGRGFHSLLDHRLCHPYVYGYRNPITREWAATIDNRQGAWEKQPVWDFPEGIVAWVRLCGEHTAKGQFQMSPPVTLNKDILDHWCAHRVHREREITHIKTISAANFHIRAVYFPMAPAQCYPALEPTCPFITACWDPKVSAMPLKSGQFVSALPTDIGECGIVQ